MSWPTLVKRLLMWSYGWHLVGPAFTQAVVDRLRLWEA